MERTHEIMDQGGPVVDHSVDAAEGNTKRTPRAAKSRQCQAQYWCSAVWDYSLEQLDQGFRPHVKRMIANPEIGAEGGKHLQCFWDFGKRIRPREKFGKQFPNIKWLKCAGTDDQNDKYCSKDGAVGLRIGLFPKDWKITRDDLRENQRELVDWLCIPVCPKFNRQIKWVWDATGEWGKTVTYTYLVDNKQVCFVGGKEADMLCAMKTYCENGNYPDLIICNLTYAKRHISYNGLESLADGIMFSGKYESGHVRFPRCQVIVFANCPPDESQMGENRFVVRELHSPWEGTQVPPEGAPPSRACPAGTCLMASS